MHATGDCSGIAKVAPCSNLSSAKAIYPLAHSVYGVLTTPYVGPHHLARIRALVTALRVWPLAQSYHLMALARCKRGLVPQHMNSVCGEDPAPIRSLGGVLRCCSLPFGDGDGLDENATFDYFRC